MRVIQMTEEQFEVLKVLLEFHLDDPKDEYYSNEAYEGLCEICGVAVPPDPEAEQD